MKYRCYDIVWDKETDDGIPSDSFNLPTEVIVELSQDDDKFGKDEHCLDDLIVDKLSDKIGWLVEGFKYEELYYTKGTNKNETLYRK